MLTVTEAASAHLARMLNEQNAPEEIAVRFVPEEEGIALRHDSERPGDTTFQRQDRTILVLDAAVSELLAEDTLYVEDAQLTLQSPDNGESHQPH